ncbi:MAG: flagellar protein [Syntrophomonadaceae bacterium]|nr:flagellar protein [Syntrophomonadaceae bacterium]
MHNKIFIPNQVRPITPKVNEPPKQTKPNATSFARVLDDKLNKEVKFSQHAKQRLQMRNIELNESDLNKINDAVAKVREKGAKDSLVLFNDLALLVSVKNNTVITAVDGANLKENVFTNIDSAVII